MKNKTLGDVLLHLVAYGSTMGGRRRRHAYIATLALALVVIWTPTILFLKFKDPSFTSEWVLLLPDASSGHTVNLDSVGQASRGASSPYANQVIDPRVNYKSIASSYTVRAKAANALALRYADFGKPQIELADQTSLMEFRLSAGSAELAQQKAEALQRSFEAQLARLREDELARREKAATASLEPLNDKLSRAQQDIVNFQLSVGVVSLDQFRELAMSVETLRQEMLRLEIERDGLSKQSDQICQALSLDPEQAASLLALQSDVGFQHLLKQSASASAQLADVSARLGQNHFEVQRSRASLDGLQTSLRKRASTLKAELPSTTLEHWARNEAARPMVSQLVGIQARLARLNGEISAHQSQIEALSARVSAGAEHAIALEDLQRKQQVAMAVFTTALAKLDLGRTDVYASYPMLQTLLPPTLPEEPDAMASTLAILGALAGSFLCLSGLILLWIRKPYIQKIFLNASSGSL